MYKKKFFHTVLEKIFGENKDTPEYYLMLKRNFVVVMLLITLLPLAAMTMINHFQYRMHIRDELTAKILSLGNKTRHSFELFLKERLSTVRFISTAYSYEELAREKNINKVFTVLKKEFGGFVDIGLIDKEGTLVSYAGPYELLGKNYSAQPSFRETLIKGNYISDVFMGHRAYPHIVLAVHRLTYEGKSWILRATIDTSQFDNLIKSMGLSPGSDAFLVNSDGILQTNSKFYGKVLDKCPLKIPRGTFESTLIQSKDPDGKEVFIASSGFTNSNFTLVIVKPPSVILKSWYALKTELFIVFAISTLVIVFAVIKITGILVRRLKESDENRKNAMAELQHNQKLSSIGRLAAGVAHEINNPLAIINEKAGLMNDLIQYSDDFKQKEKFTTLTGSVISSVDRCRAITHRLLGFARRVEVQIETININSVIKEVVGFLEREAVYRKIDLRLNLPESVRYILTDRGQIQQVFLNLLTNAFAAVDDGGVVTVTSSNADENGVKVIVSDNGCGMSDSVIEKIFDPFFSTKKGKGTGLGLSITYGIIKKMGGDITVRSSEGKGTEFTVFIPGKHDTVSKEDNNEHND